MFWQPKYVANHQKFIQVTLTNSKHTKLTDVKEVVDKLTYLCYSGFHGV